MAENTQILVKLEDSLLHNLANSTGDILSDTKLIATLEETKSKSLEVSAKLDQARGCCSMVALRLHRSRSLLTHAALHADGFVHFVDAFGHQRNPLAWGRRW
jgi:hypothetical protein